jgi:hypothetical protein
MFKVNGKASRRGLGITSVESQLRELQPGAFFAPQNNGPPASFTAPESGVAQSLNFVSFWVSHTMLQSNDINLEWYEFCGLTLKAWT